MYSICAAPVQPAHKPLELQCRGATIVVAADAKNRHMMEEPPQQRLSKYKRIAVSVFPDICVPL
jgi:hypothetical protein